MRQYPHVMTDSASTSALLAAIAASDEAAFERFFRIWYPRLADHAHRMLHDRDRAEDAAQEVFVAFWRGRGRLPTAEALPGYLHRAVRNRALNQLRQTLGHQIDPESSLETAVAPVDDGIERRELALALTSAINGLPPRTREIFLLSREQGLTYASIATTLEISVKTVETLMGRALRALRESLSGL